MGDAFFDSLARCCRPLLRSCSLGDTPPPHGYQLHAALVKNGLFFLSSISSNISSALFHMYAALGPPASALRAFEEIPVVARFTPDWTALISCHIRHALPSRAILFFRSMLRAGASPDEVTLIALLSASARLSDNFSGYAAHLLFFKLGLPFTAASCNAAMDMYAKSSRMDEAWKLFKEMKEPTIVSWTIILTGALRWEGLRSGQEVFDRMPQRNDVAWTVMISACIEAGRPRDALSLLGELLFDGVHLRWLNHVSMCSLLSACSQAGDLTVGRWLHTHFIKATSFADNYKDHLLKVNTALIDMYGKCGRVDNALTLFERMAERNVVSWNAMLSGLSMQGMGLRVLHLFTRMVTEGEEQPDDITMVSVLSACSRSGLVEEGRNMFQELGSIYKITPKIEHFACMVDLLGRAGCVDEAESLVRAMPMQPNEVVLGSLLASCALHGKLELGRKLMQELVQLYPDNTEYHVLLSNMFAASQRHTEADDLRMVVKNRGIQKTPGMSFIEINGIVHWFTAGDKTHPQTTEIYTMLVEIVRRLKLAGYTIDAASQNSRVADNYMENGDEREEREQALLVHSERLALALGLMSTKPGVTLRIVKNIRICSDCHSAMKLCASIFEREIIIRDRNRFHCFKAGLCSCSDFW
ncbi:pentatricopeptide repeat-containing protein At5g15340, mitochondrial-like [Dioscorea cayenensis subsp. rotundata]|uniref:Pentatricopeptide repeat-containing protein At5g15340, mitochondrial-like n=1 Tax=Dioscorea cayennensis subsp. rotundata TaxID=55577 RepID=A0AB40C092_DIOCR|nr:pentatricopeptide repeat-containing protein At5g15340, mitochondrial-like [Dioscorea cayenensis subsp. rotundata]XP_039133067.1 pentatricopeptide repeat-containing protein At5g15340, mitochondrial-like [Dioscorea cayenensis subsp. rotundata]